MRDVLHRHLLALLFTAVLVVLFVTQTIPALRERAAARDERLHLELELERRREDVRRRELWLEGASTDPFLAERLAELRRRSPGLPGPWERRAADDAPAGR